MDLIEEEENELFENGENLDAPNEDITNQENDVNDEGANDSDDKEDDKKPVKPKRIIRNPRAKLNAEVLKGPKGLGNLEKCFERVQFKGKGYEEQDLNIMLKTYEYWCHRMFPKFPFKDCIAKIETLGSKGPIQTHLKKVRSGMIDAETEEALPLPDFNSEDEDNGPAQSESAPTSSQAIIADIPVELTEEQLETIRRNREKAEKLRQERLRKIREKAAVNLPEKNVISESTPSTSRLSTEVNQDDNVSIRSQLGNGKEFSSENGCDREEETTITRNKSPGRLERQQSNNVESESDDELPSFKRLPKKVFYDDDDEEREEPISRIGETTLQNGSQERVESLQMETESDDELPSFRKPPKKVSYADGDEHEEETISRIEESTDQNGLHERVESESDDDLPSFKKPPKTVFNVDDDDQEGEKEETISRIEETTHQSELQERVESLQMESEGDSPSFKKSPKKVFNADDVRDEEQIRRVAEVETIVRVEEEKENIEEQNKNNDVIDLMVEEKSTNLSSCNDIVEPMEVDE